MASKRARRNQRKQVAARSAQAKANRARQLKQGDLSGSIHMYTLSSMSASELDTVLQSLEREANLRAQSAEHRFSTLPSLYIEEHKPPHSVSHNARYLASRPLVADQDIASMPAKQARLARRRNRKILDARMKVASVDSGQWIMGANPATALPQGRGVGEMTPRARTLKDDLTQAKALARGLNIVRQKLAAGSTALGKVVQQIKDFAISLGHRVVGGVTRQAVTPGPDRKPSKRQRKHMRKLDKAVSTYGVPGMTHNQYQALMRAFELLGGPDLVAWWQHLTPQERAYLYRDTNMVQDFFRAIDSPRRGRLQNGQAPWQAMTRRGSDWLVDAIIDTYREEVAYTPREMRYSD